MDKNEFSIYAFDAPGHGNAEGKFGNVLLYAKTLKTVFNQIDRVETIIGHSIGSFASLYFFNKYPVYQPLKFVSLASPGNAHDFIDVYARTVQLSERSIQNLYTYFNQYAGLSADHFHIKYFIENMDAKGLIIHDKEDRDADVKYAIQMHQLWKDSELIITQGMGHRLIDPEILDRVTEYIIKGTEGCHQQPKGSFEKSQQ